jgi:hypothetical protein
MSERAIALPAPSLRWRHGLILSAIAFGIAGLVSWGPIAQSQAYHQFADQRLLGGIPNAMDVLSNLAFLLSGAYGLWVVARGRAVVRERWETTGWVIVFIGVVATAAGSAWYHVAPDDPSLAWDRLPMTIVFAAFASLILGERVSPTLGRLSLVPFLLTGPASVAVWRWNGDLRMYAAVQYLPMLAIFLALFLLPSRYDRVRELWVAVGWYGVAKACEALDGPIYDLTGLVSGHTMKHVAAALGPIWFVHYLTRRRPIETP